MSLLTMKKYTIIFLLVPYSLEMESNLFTDEDKRMLTEIWNWYLPNAEKLINVISTFENVRFFY